ncbi:hypothetical protein H6G89_07685 [Oscillatoria sp. FACHB-1407]|uniref:hypothetical protein n=1 Tax=Oscillatoria sp. FACHB-1407 TaxID=2692847 RepID=UPI001687472B|nr:hypothetical protein [Oscillatoria sp. FACHB-1407]MBD2460923.1 hypothetical protein [Oscillatoria sp. FACHB-1407]
MTVVCLAIATAMAPAFYQPMGWQANAGTTMQQEDTKPVSRYAFERVQGQAEEPTQEVDELGEIKSVRELREKITAPVYPKTKGQGASDNSGQLDNSIPDYEAQARQRVKQTTENLSQ